MYFAPISALCLVRIVNEGKKKLLLLGANKETGHVLKDFVGFFSPIEDRCNCVSNNNALGVTSERQTIVDFS